MHLKGLFVTAILCVGAAIPALAQSTDPWTTGQLIEAGQLAKLISQAGRPRPLVLYIGPSILYRSGHIPGARYIGPSAQTPGLEDLKKQLQALPKDGDIVLYCGCCPWEHCPNIRPAFNLARQLGRQKVRILYLPRSFKEDWTDKGFSVEKGQ